MLNNTITNSRYRTYEDVTGQKNKNLTRSPARASESLLDIPPIDEITGESVMPSDSVLVPLFPAPAPASARTPQFSQGYLKEHIGQFVRVEFLVGADSALIDRVGTLMQVGEDYIVIQPVGTDDLLLCDLYSIKFVTISK